MKRIITATIALAVSVMFAAAQPAKERYQPGHPRIAELEKAVSAKSNDRFTVAFDELTSGCNACHAAASKPFIRIQRPIESPLTNQNFTPVK